MYSLAFSQFTDKDWQNLSRLYRQLPQYLDDRALKLPYWFGCDEARAPYLWASVEPGGLQVAGLLSQSQLDVWHERFINHGSAYDFPLHQF